ncbi:MAG: 5'-3' exonuclease H3TH domain-containing protein [Candidatus Gracilibacteria bacterium]|jgi:DNA polymerase-1
MPKLILIDGNAIFYRAFHALPLFKSSKGEFTNAIYGFLKMTFQILKQENPEYIAIAFDCAEKTHRHIEYEEYKAQRKPPPPELYPQLPRLKQGLEIMNIALFELPGYEADDIIGTLATEAEKKDFQTLIVTGDKDAFQLVTDKIQVRVPISGLSTVIDYTPAKIKEKMGLIPAQIVDYKALKGDPSDNIKGINGIGDKQAVDLLQKYEHLENIYAHIDELTPSQRQKFEDGRKDALFSKKLATIVREVPIDLDFEKCRFQKVPYTKMKAYLEEIEFRGFLNKMMEFKDFVDMEGVEVPQVSGNEPKAQSEHQKIKQQKSGQQGLSGQFEHAQKSNSDHVPAHNPGPVQQSLF